MKIDRQGIIRCGSVKNTSPVISVLIRRINRVDEQTRNRPGQVRRTKVTRKGVAIGQNETLRLIDSNTWIPSSSSTRDFGTLFCTCNHECHFNSFFRFTYFVHTQKRVTMINAKTFLELTCKKFVFEGVIQIEGSKISSREKLNCLELRWANCFDWVVRLNWVKTGNLIATD